ncbi:testin LIM domain protein isoform X2 [Nomia melanderi]|nr:LIM domain-containing protein jub isoform X2 [Nomia melanderi]
MICKSTCPGLDLHFWRKTCKNCKCSKDDHDVDDEDFPQFDLLFGSSKKYKKKPILLRIHDRKEHAQEAFEWIPPDTTKEIATEYMKALPIEKLPIKGSAGAALRRQLLQKQLPLHDVDYKVCDKLTEQEQKQFEKYLENIKKYVGQGTVTKILSARPFDRLLMTPANATDMQPCSPQNKHNIQSNTVQLRTPSSFIISKSPYKKDAHSKSNNYEASLPISVMVNNTSTTPVFETLNTISNNCEIAKSEPIRSGVYNKGISSINCQRVNNNHRDITSKEVSIPNYSECSDPEGTMPQNSVEHYEEVHNVLKNPPTSLSHSKSINNEAYIAEAILADALLPPSTVHANDIIGSTLDQKGLKYIREKLTNKYSNQGNHQLQPSCNAYSFANDLDNNDLLKNNISPQSINADNKSDIATIITAAKNTPNALTPLKGKIQTVEKPTNESKRTEAEKEVMRMNSQKVQSTPLDAIMAHSKLTADSLTPASLPRMCEHSKISNHPAKLNNYSVPSTIIYSEKLQNHAFPYKSIDSTNQPADNSLKIEQLKDGVENLTVDPVKLQKCHKCEEVIRVGDVAVITEKAKNAMWHPGCFVCDTCNELLVDLVYFYYKNKLYCGRDLSSLLGIPRCFACDELIFLREYTVAEGHNYHVKHFCCWDCDIPLAGKQYTTESDRPLCLPCYQKTYAKTCNTCNKVIAADQQGVALKDLNFHATGSCFCCHVCNKNLLKARTAIKEKKLFCSKECIGKFSQLPT